jgi:hypothetical protein
MICPSLNRLFLIIRLLMTDSHINRGIPRGAGHYLRDRLTWMRFLGLGLGDPVPDANTIWTSARR